MQRRQIIQWGAASLAAPAFLAQAQSFPSKPIKLIIAFPAGGPTDITMRSLADNASKILGQPVIVENKPGAGGTLPAQALQTSAADGYTVAQIPLGVFRLPYTTKINWDPVKDISYVLNVTGYAFGLVVPADSPLKTWTHFVAWAKANPGKLSYASGSSSAIVSGATFAHNAGLDLLHVPYKSSPPALNDVMGGRVSMMFVVILTGLPHVNGNALRALAVTTKERSPLVPHLPSMQEACVPDFDISSWQGYFGPAGLPKEIVVRLNTEIRKIVENPEIKAKLATLGMDAFSGTPEQLGTFVNEQLVLWEKLITNAKIEKQ